MNSLPFNHESSPLPQSHKKNYCKLDVHCVFRHTCTVLKLKFNPFQSGYVCWQARCLSANPLFYLFNSCRQITWSNLLLTQQIPALWMYISIYQSVILCGSVCLHIIARARAFTEVALHEGWHPFCSNIHGPREWTAAKNTKKEWLILLKVKLNIIPVSYSNIIIRTRHGVVWLH